MSDQLQPERTWEFIYQVPRHKCQVPMKQDVAANFMLGDVVRCKECKASYRLARIEGNALKWNRVRGQRE